MKVTRRNLITMGASSIVLPITIGGSAQADVNCGPFYSGVQQCRAGIRSQVANRSISQGQYMSQWCWAACISMVFEYYGRPVSQPNIVSQTFGRIVDFPAQSWQIFQALNRTWRDDHGRRFTAQADTYSANPVTAAQDLASNHPLIIGTTNGTTGHAMVLTALDYRRDAVGYGEVTRAIVRDPWPGRGLRTLSSSEWMSTMLLARIRVFD